MAKIRIEKVSIVYTDWKRYLIGNPLFLWRVIKQRLGLLRLDEDTAT